MEYIPYICSMNHRNAICFVKTLIFMIFCMLAFSSGANGDLNSDKAQGHVLSSEVRHIHAGAILAPTANVLSAIHPVIIPEINNPSCVNCKTGFDSYFFSHRFNTLQKKREIIIPLPGSIYYRLNATDDKDDLPDLS